MHAIPQFFGHDSQFEPGMGIPNFSPTHLTYLAIVLVFIVCFSIAFRKWAKPTQERTICGMAIALIALELIRMGWGVAIGHFDPTQMLPLHLCGIMVVTIPIAVFSKSPLAQQFAYCGMSGALIALITPDGRNYPLWHIQTLQSICTHTLLVLVPILMLVAGQYRPQIKWLPACFGLLICVAFLDGIVNTIIGSNYLFICQAPPATPAAIYEHWVGRPWYVGLLLLTVFIVWTLMYVPWEIAAKKHIVEGSEVEQTA